jgi:hypothetical protein
VPRMQRTRARLRRSYNSRSSAGREPWHAAEELQVRIRRACRMETDEVTGSLHNVGCRGIVAEMLPRQPVCNGASGTQPRHRSVRDCSTLSARTVTHSLMRCRLVGPQSTRDRCPVACGTLR